MLDPLIYFDKFFFIKNEQWRVKMEGGQGLLEPHF